MRLALGLLVVLHSGLLAACIQPPPDVNPPELTTSERDVERQIAAQGMDYVRQELRMHPDPVVQRYVRRIGERVVAVSDRPDIPWTFQVVDEDQMNAFTIGDGKVFVYSGLLARLENEAQVASVMAHEIAHVTHYHTLKTAEANQLYGGLLGTAAAIAGEGQLAQLAAGVVNTIAQSGFSRDLEDQADRVGVRYTANAGYDVDQFPRIFEIFMEEGGDSPQLFNDLFGDHSTNAERIAATRQLIASEYTPQRGNPTVGREAHQEILNRLR